MFSSVDYFTVADRFVFVLNYDSSLMSGATVRFCVFPALTDCNIMTS